MDLWAFWSGYIENKVFFSILLKKNTIFYYENNK